MGHGEGRTGGIVQAAQDVLRAGVATLDRLLQRLLAHQDALLMVLERPEVPLHTNASENDIRSHVIRRKISGSTRSDRGRDCRDGFPGVFRTCDKLGGSAAGWRVEASPTGIEAPATPPPAGYSPAPGRAGSSPGGRHRRRPCRES
nr:transposase [Rhodovibrio sodomensis]